MSFTQHNDFQYVDEGDLDALPAYDRTENHPNQRASVFTATTQKPLHHITFTPELVERSNIIKLTHLSKEEIIERLEQERLQRLHRAASNLKANMLSCNRCPLCTLVIPCKHYKSTQQLYFNRGKLFKKQEWALLSQENRNQIIKIKLNLQKMVRDDKCRSMTPVRSDNLSRPPTIQDIDQQTTSQINQTSQLQVQEEEPAATVPRLNESYMSNKGGVVNGSRNQLSQRQSSISATATENFLLKIKINALKNKMGYRGLTMEQRAELEERIQQEYFHYHFDLGSSGGVDECTALEKELELQELQDKEQEVLRGKMHPWHGKSKQQRKEYIEKLLMKFKTDQIVKENNEQVKMLQDFKKKKAGPSSVPPKNRQSTKSARTSPKQKRVVQQAHHKKDAKSMKSARGTQQQKGSSRGAANKTGTGINKWDVQQIENPEKNGPTSPQVVVEDKEQLATVTSSPSI